MSMFFEDWTNLIKIAVVGTLAYVGLIIMLRLSGKRTLAQMSAVDFIGTVALGSTLSIIVLGPDSLLIDGLFSLGLLIVLQLIFAQASLHFLRFKRLLHAQPRLLFYKGEFKEKAMKAERVGKEELLHAVRDKGIISLEQVEAIVLETNGMFSVLKTVPHEEASALENVYMD